MISTGQILAAGLVTGVAVAVVGAAMRWSAGATLAAALLSLVLIIVWRAICNAAGLNGDYLPAVSAGDTGCLFAGALGPAVVSRLSWFSGRRPATSPLSGWLPALVGGIVGFVVDVLIL